MYYSDLQHFNMRQTFVFIITALLISSCATSALKLGTEVEDWIPDTPQSLDEIYHSIYLIGDAGGAEADSSTLPLLRLKTQLNIDNREDKQTDVIFLGDNIYPVGMPPIGHSDREEAEHKLNVQLESVRDFSGNITFVPGNHDWYEYGREGLKRQETYIENYLSQYNEKFTDFFRPSNGCGNIDIMNISDDISLVTIDSHWFLTDKEEEYDFSDCEIQSRNQFVTAFKDSMALLKNKKVLLTMHHPLFTTGKHGGNYNLSAVLMPLSKLKKGLVVPLPLTGYISTKMRTRTSPQDTKSSEYASYRNYLISPIEDHGNIIVAAGHEHTLQHNQVNKVNYIVSGSGSKRGPVGLEDYTKFAYGNYGYALVDYYRNGQIWLTFYASSEDDDEFGIVYRNQLF